MKKISPLPLLLFLFIVLRIFILLTEPPPDGFGFADFFRATSAHDLMSDRKFNIFDYTYRHNEGGSLVVTLILALFFKIFNISVFSLHLVGLFFSLCSFILGYYLIKKYFGLNEAIIFGVLFAFAPQAYVVLSSITWGSHMESILFTFLIIYFLGKLFSSQNNASKKEYFYSSFLGFICGFSIWFAYINIIGLIACIICTLIFEKGFFIRKSFLFFLLFFIVGLSPLVIYNITYASGRAGLVLYKPLYAHFFNTSFKKIVSKAFSLFVFDFPLSLFFKDGLMVSRKYLAYSSYFIYITIFSLFIIGGIKSGFFNIIRSNKKREFLNTFVFIYLATFFIIYLLSDFKVDPLNICKGYRYILAIAPLFFILFSQAYSFLSKKSRIFKVVIYGLILLNLLGVSSLLNFKNFLKNTTVSPISYWSFGISIASKFGDNLEKCVFYSQKLDLNSKNYFFYGLGGEMAYRYLANPEALSLEFKKIPEQYRMSFYMSLGENLGEMLRYNVREITAILGKLEKKYLKYAYIGLGVAVVSVRLSEMMYFSSQINDEYLCSFYEGVGVAILYSTQYGLEKCSAIIANSLEIDNKYKNCCFSGLSLIILLDERMPNWKEFLNTLRAFSDKVPERYRLNFLKGINEKYAIFKDIFY